MAESDARANQKHVINFAWPKEENFKIIGSAHNDYHLCLKESLLIQKLKPRINTSEKSVPLKLF